MAKHTPGPWHVANNVAARRNRGALETIIEMGPFGAFVVADASTSASANARLIAAAPDLLEAAKRMLYHFGILEDNPGLHPEAVGASKQLRAAITKAEPDFKPVPLDDEEGL